MEKASAAPISPNNAHVSHERLMIFCLARELVIQCTTDGLTTQTARSRLNGSVNLFALCAITEINGRSHYCGALRDRRSGCGV
jgi:hypothetical protein